MHTNQADQLISSGPSHAHFIVEAKSLPENCSEYNQGVWDNRLIVLVFDLGIDKEISIYENQSSLPAAFPFSGHSLHECNITRRNGTERNGTHVIIYIDIRF